jgi:hypothetical protein
MAAEDEAGYKAGSAYLDLDVRDNTGPGLQRVKEKIERGDHVNLPVGIDQPDLESFQARLIEAVKSIKPEVTVKLGDPVTPQWKQDTDEKTRQYSPPPVKTQATNPIDTAWRAQFNASVRSIAAEALKIPATADTAEFRTDLAAKLEEISKTASAKIPAELGKADEFKAKAELLAAEVSATVKAHVPVVVDEDKAKADLKKAGEDASAEFSSAFGNGIAPLPGLIGAAVIAGAPLVGAAFTTLATVGFVALDGVVAAQSAQVKSSWLDLTSDLAATSDAVAPQVAAPFVQAIAVARSQLKQLTPEIQSDMVTASQAVMPLTNGLLAMARNAIPGVSMALVTSQPIISAWSDLFAHTGQSIGNMFDQFSQHSAQFGTSVRSLDSIVQSAMSFLTNLITQAGDAWAAHSGQINDGIDRLFSGLSSLTGSVLPALTGELANVLSVVGLLAQGLGGLEHMIGPLAGDLTSLALTAKLLGVNLTSIPSAISAIPGKLEAAAASGGRFAGVSGALADVLPAVGEGLAGIAAPLGIAAVYMSSVAQHQQDLVDAGTALGQSMVKGGSAAQEAGQKLADLQSNVDSLKGQLANATTQQNMLTASIEYGRGGASTAGNVAKSYRDNIADLQKELGTAQQAQQAYTAQLGPVGVAQAQAAQAQKDYNDAVGKYGPSSSQAEAAAKKLAVANQNVTSEQQNMTNALRQSTAQAELFATPAAQLYADLNKIGDASAKDSDKITAMKDALIRLQGGTIPVGDAMEAIDKVMSSIDQQMQQGINRADGYGKALLNADGTVRTATKNGQSFRDTLTDLRGKFVDAAAAIVAQDEAQGKSAEDAKKHADTVLQAQIPAIEKLGASMGLTKQQVDDAIKAMGAWPDQLTTVVATPGMVNAQQAMDILKGKVLDVPTDHSVHTTALTQEAMDALRTLGYTVNTLPDGTVVVTGDTSLALQAAQSVVRQINGMTAVVHINAQGNTDSVHFTATGSTMSAHGNLLYPMAGGGVLTPMSSAQATVVPPDSWRVVGDNMQYPELYAPLDGSDRSKSLIGQAAVDQGVMPRKNITVNVTQHVSTQDPHAAANAALAGVAFVVGSVR